MELAAIGVIATLAVAGVTVLTFWMNFSERISKAAAAAEAAKIVAEEAQKRAGDAQTQAATLSAAFGLYREQVAKEYIHRESMREMEDRLTAAIDRLGDRLDRLVEHRP